MKVMSGYEDLVVGGGVESMSRWAMGSDGGAWAMDPRVNQATGFAPQGIGADLIATLEGFSRRDVDAFAVRSQQHARSEEHTSERQSLMRISYAVFCLQKHKATQKTTRQKIIEQR